MKRILIIRPSAAGDIVMASPMIRTLRRSFPEARIVWLAEPSMADLLHHPELDGVIFWDKGRWRQMLKGGRLLALFREIRSLRRQLRSERFDLVLDAQGLLRSRVLARLSGATRRVGFDSREPGRFLMTEIVSRGPGARRMSSEYRHMMETIGLSVDDFFPELAVKAEDADAMGDRLRAAGIDDGYAVICPFTTRPQKHWFADRWAALAGEIRKRMGLPVVMLGGPNDVSAARSIAIAAENALHDLTGATTLGQSMAVLQDAALIVGVDTGLTHMGTAFGRPTAALFGATRPYLETGRETTAVIYHPRECSPCRRRPTCSGEFDCMAAISVDEALTTVLEIGSHH
jgi:heptosyltransferase I